MSAIDELRNKLNSNSGGATPAAPAQSGSSIDALRAKLSAKTPAPSPVPVVQTPKAEIKTEDKDDDRNLWDKIKDLVSFTADKAVVGVAEGTEGIVNTLGYFPQLAQKSAMQQAAGGAAIAAAFSKDPLVDEYAKKQQTAAQEDINKEMKTIANFGDKQAAKVEEKYADVPLSKATRFVGDVAQGVGGMATTILGNIVVPGLGTAAMAASAFGNSVQEAQKQGAGAGEAAVYGLANSAIEFATEKVFGGMKINGKEIFGTGLLDKAKDALVKKASNGAARASLNTAFSFIGEGLEEFAAEYGQSLANRLTINTEDREWSDVRKDAFRSALIGGTIGGLLNVGSSIEAGKSVTVKEAAEMAAEEAATEIKNAMPTQGEISPSGGISAEPTTYTTNAENVSRVDPDAPGFENANGFLGKLKATAKDISDYVERALSRSRKLPDAVISDEVYPDLAIADVTPKLAQKIYDEYGVDISNAQHFLSDNNLRHIFNSHGPYTKEADPVIAADLKMIPTIINDASDVYYVPRQDGKRGLVYEYHYADGTTHYLEQILDGNKLVNAQMIKTPPGVSPGIPGLEQAKANKKGINSAPGAVVGNATSPQMYVQDVWNDTSNANVAQPSANVNELGAANFGYTINEGEQVPTQSKSTVNNINLNDMQRKAVEPPTHERISEAESLHRAQLGLYTDSEGNIVDYQNSIDELVDADHALSGVESDRLQLLLDEAGKRNDIDNVKRIAAKLQENATFAARVLQATQKWIDEGPATRLAAMYQLVDKYAKTHKAKKGKTIEIPDFLAKAYLEADTDAKRDEVVSDIQDYVAQQTRTSFGEAFTALRYVNMLGNFKTQGRNFLGNATMLTTTRVKDEVAAVVEGLANAISRGKTGRTKSMFVGRDFVKAAKADYANVKREIMRYGKYSKEDFKGEFVEGIEDSRKLLPPGLEQYRRLTNLAMEGGDAIFSKAAYSRSLVGYLKANGVSAEQLAAGNVDPALMEKARAYAIKQAQETTFRDSNQLSDWVSKAGRSEDTPKLVKAVGEGLMPFRRTPANVMVRAYEYSPLGLINTAVKVAEAAKGKATASDIIEALSKTLTGTGLMALGYWLRDNGLLRGGGDEDEEEIDALMNRQDWSIVIPGKGSYTFDWAAPASLTMFTGAVLNDLYTDEELTLADWFDALASLSEPFVQMSMLNGINDTLDSIKYTDNNLWQLAGQLAASYITQGLTNTLMGQIERSTEDVRMSTYTEADGFLPEWMQRSIGKASAKIPGVDYQQTEYLNEFGETESNGGIGQRILENFFSPGYWEATKEGESAYDFAQRVYDTLGVNAFPDAYPEKEVEYDGEKYPLTQEERNEYQQIRGEAAKEYMELLDGNRDFDTSNKKNKRSIISKALSFANEQAKNNALRDNGVVIEQSNVDKVKEQMSPSEYINWLIADTKATAPDGYAEGSTPQWQQFEIALSLPDSLAVAMIIAQGGDTGRRISAAVDNGISVERAVEYYRATSERNAEGKSPSKGEVNQRLTAAGFTADERRIMRNAFELTFK